MSRHHFKKIQDLHFFSGHDTEILYTFYERGFLCLRDFEIFYEKKYLDFWHIFDLYREEDKYLTLWSKEKLLSLASNTFECLALLRDITISQQERTHLIERAKKTASSTDDFLSLYPTDFWDNSLFHRLLNSPNTIDDFILIDNFLHEHEQYAHKRQTYREKMLHAISSIEDLKNIYIYSHDASLREQIFTLLQR